MRGWGRGVRAVVESFGGAGRVDEEPAVEEGAAELDVDDRDAEEEGAECEDGGDEGEYRQRDGEDEEEG